MTTPIVKLSEQEILALKQLASQPGIHILFKLLEGEASRATAEAIANSSPDKERRLTLLDDARSTHRVVGNLVNLINDYTADGISVQPPAKEAEWDDPLRFSHFSERNTH